MNSYRFGYFTLLISFIFFCREMLTVDWIVSGRKRKPKSDSSRQRKRGSKFLFLKFCHRKKTMWSKDKQFDQFCCVV